jgi:hypothetical protein
VPHIVDHRGLSEDVAALDSVDRHAAAHNGELALRDDVAYAAQS